MSLKLFTIIGVLLVGLTIWIGPLELLQEGMIRLTEDTEYSPGYSERAFQAISIGDTEAKVLAALGRPLSESDAEPHSSWLYTAEFQPDFAATGRYPDMRVSYTAVRFNEAGQFADAFGQLSQGDQHRWGAHSSSAAVGNGMNTLALTDAVIKELEAERVSKDEFQARFGSPTVRFNSPTVKWLRYSHSPGSTDYRLRTIGIDRNGKVCETRSEIYWD